MQVRNLMMCVFLCGGASIGAALAQDANAGKAVFTAQCSACHAVQAGKNLQGPSLFGIVGRPAGQAPGFHYSEANKKSGLTWDAATLNTYLAIPRRKYRTPL